MEWYESLENKSTFYITEQPTALGVIEGVRFFSNKL